MLDHPRFQAFVSGIASMLRHRLLGLFGGDREQIDRFQQQVKTGLRDIDYQLSLRYPDRYPDLKQQANDVKIWYDEQISEQQANPERPLLADRQYQHLADRVEELSKNVAQTERQIRSEIAAKLHSNNTTSN